MKYLISRRFEMGVLVLGLGLAFYFVARPLKESSWKGYCQTNLKQIGLATMQYARDYDEGWMIAANWKEGLAPYGKFQRNAPTYSCPKTAKDYAYNINVSASYMEAVSKAADLALFYEPSNGVNADNGKNWASNGVHGDGSNVGFADGHVKWLRAKPAFWQASLNNKANIAAKRATRRRDFAAREKRRLDWNAKHAKKR